MSRSSRLTYWDRYPSWRGGGRIGSEDDILLASVAGSHTSKSDRILPYHVQPDLLIDIDSLEYRCDRKRFGYSCPWASTNIDNVDQSLDLINSDSKNCVADELGVADDGQKRIPCWGASGVTVYEEAVPLYTAEEMATIKELHTDWFPVDYDAGFYTDVQKGKVFSMTVVGDVATVGPISSSRDSDTQSKKIVGESRAPSARSKQFQEPSTPVSDLASPKKKIVGFISIRYDLAGRNDIPVKVIERCLTAHVREQKDQNLCSRSRKRAKSENANNILDATASEQSKFNSPSQAHDAVINDTSTVRRRNAPLDKTIINGGPLTAKKSDESATTKKYDEKSTIGEITTFAVLVFTTYVLFPVVWVSRFIESFFDAIWDKIVDQVPPDNAHECYEDSGY